MNRTAKNILLTGVILLLLVVLIVWILWGNRALMISPFTIQSSKLPEAFSGFRIAQISDLHNARFGPNNETLLSMLSDTRPDIIVITGDLVDSRRTDIDTGIAFGAEAAKIAPTYYVSGNHEARLSDYPRLKSGLKNAGVTVLENEKTEIERQGQTITLLGIDDPSFYTDYLLGDSSSVAEAILETLMPGHSTYTILLSHRPELFESYEKLGIDLVFSGHAHGGQFRIPFIGGMVAPNQGLFPKYDGGLYEQDGTCMIVSRGIGNSIIPFRINNRPEIVVAQLHPEK